MISQLPFENADTITGEPSELPDYCEKTLRCRILFPDQHIVKSAQSDKGILTHPEADVFELLGSAVRFR